MPLKQTIRQQSYYGVFLNRYVSIEAKKQREEMEEKNIPGSLVGCCEATLLYWGLEKRIAARCFDRTCREMLMEPLDPLVIGVAMQENSFKSRRMEVPTPITYQIDLYWNGQGFDVVVPVFSTLRASGTMVSLAIDAGEAAIIELLAKQDEEGGNREEESEPVV